jgi:hypothetical protein
VTGQGGQAPGLVKIPLSGDPGDIDAVAALISGGLGRELEQIERSAPYPNRRDPGARVYLTVLISPARPATRSPTHPVRCVMQGGATHEDT